MTDFLPVSRADMEKRGIEQLDFIFITGDAYVDHSTFGPAILTRLLEDEGFTVGIIAQPDWKGDGDFQKLGEPKYAFLISSGNIDSMVAHYTVAKRRRTEDAYSPGKKMGLRPDRAVIVYTNKVRSLYKHTPILIGGLEASLRRFAHYDYWEDAVRRSVLVDAQADLLLYGMGEHQITEVAHRLAHGEDIRSIRDIKGSCYLAKESELPESFVECPSFETVAKDKLQYALAFKLQSENHDPIRGKVMVQAHEGRYVVQNPPSPPLGRRELDRVYALPYMRTYHPMYEKLGGVPAIEEVEFSITHNRGCFGGCNFCSLAFHQGRMVTSRSIESCVEEAKELTHQKGFKGYIHDVGGPTANFRHPSCGKQLGEGMCPKKRCLAPTPCENLVADHREYVELLRQVRQVPGVKRVFVRSGVRYDYVLKDKDDTFTKELVEHYVSGQLRVAPEHCSAQVLQKMGKPSIESYYAFEKKFYRLTKEAGKEQYLVPYLMSSHPGATMADAIELALFLKREKIRPQQVQDFYPTPGTVSTCMYYTGLDPITLQKVYVPKEREEKAMQRALLQYFLPQNQKLVIKALVSEGRHDLIGVGKDCLVRPDPAYVAKFGRKLEKEQKRAASPYGRKGPQGAKKGRNKWQREGAKRTK